MQPRKPNTFWEACSSKLIPRQLSVPYARNNGQFIMFSLFLAIVNIALFVSRSIEYRNFKNWDGSTNYWIIFARAAGTYMTTFAFSIKSITCVI